MLSTSRIAAAFRSPASGHRVAPDSPLGLLPRPEAAVVELSDTFGVRVGALEHHLELSPLVGQPLGQNDDDVLFGRADDPGDF